MRATLVLLQQSLRLTLFTRENCSLCGLAKNSIAAVRQKGRPFDYAEVDIMQDGHGQWKDMYEFDVPVVRCYKYRLATSNLILTRVF